MKLASFSILSVISIFAGMSNDNFSNTIKSITYSNGIKNSGLTLQPDPKEGISKMRCIEFKSQDFCRVELKDFEFDVRFSVVSATVFFTGANFKGIEKGVITGSSLKSIKNLMNRCLPGSIVVFDDIKVKGPGNEVRKIAGSTLQLF
jgi:hypothetical protein